jgi:uncharacterized cupin superfamily protein
MSANRFRSVCVLACAMVVLAAACGGSDDGGSDGETTDAPTTTTVPAEPVAVAALGENVEARVAPAPDFAPVAATIDARLGDAVRTDATGFAEIVYPDGSLTRLDADTELEIRALSAIDEVVATETELVSGRVWNRVEQLAGPDDEFTVDTPVASATVRGTAFVVDCRAKGACTFTVLEGTIIVTPDGGEPITLEAPRSLTVTAAGAPDDAVLVPFDAAFADPWIVDNTDRDVDAGFSDRVDMYRTYGPALASIEGTFRGTRTITESECLDGPGCVPGAVVGDVAEREYTFSVDCSKGYPCTGQVDAEYLFQGEVTSKVVPVVGSPEGFTYTFDSTGPACFLDDGTGLGGLEITWFYDARPTAAEARNGKWVVTALEMSGWVENIVTQVDEQCAAAGYTSTREESSIVVSR